MRNVPELKGPTLDCWLDQELTTCPLLPVHVFMTSEQIFCATVGLPFPYLRQNIPLPRTPTISKYVFVAFKSGQKDNFSKKGIRLPINFFSLTKK